MSLQKISSLTGLNKRYKFVQKSGDDFACIKLIGGDYDGVVYKHNNIKFASKPNAKDEIPLNFDYDILVNPNNAKIDTQEFVHHIGDILVEVVEYQLINGTLKFND